MFDNGVGVFFLIGGRKTPYPRNERRAKTVGEAAAPAATAPTQSPSGGICNRVNSPNRDVLIAKKISGRGDWIFKKWTQSYGDGSSRIIDTGFNGSAICIAKRLRKYVDYLQKINPDTRIIKTVGDGVKFVLGDQESRGSTRTKIIPICFPTNSRRRKRV